MRPDASSRLLLLLAIGGAVILIFSSDLPAGVRTFIISVAAIALYVALYGLIRKSSTEINEGINQVSRNLNWVMQDERERLAGITRVYPYHREALEEFRERLESGGRRADILVTSVFDRVASVPRRQLDLALQQGSHVRILLLDPASPFVEPLSFTDLYSELRAELHESIALCQLLRRNYGPLFEFRMLQEPQPFHMYFVEEFAMIIPRLPLHTHRGLAIRVDRGRMFDDLQEVFDSLWLTSRAVPDAVEQRATV